MKLREGQFHVMAGEIYITCGAVRLDTTLGSCIAVTAWHPKLKIGAMTHYLLPEPGRTERRKPDGYYGCFALATIATDLGRQAPLRQFQFHVYGGGSLIGRNPLDDGVAQRNIRFAMAWAEQHRIHFHSSSVGGSACRRISFFPDTGIIDLKVYEMDRPPSL